MRYNKCNDKCDAFISMAISTRIGIIISVVVGAIVVVTLALSVATDAWLYTTETTEFVEVNFTRKTTIKAQMGLWKVCKLEGTFEINSLISKIHMGHLLE